MRVVGKLKHKVVQDVGNGWDDGNGKGETKFQGLTANFMSVGSMSVLSASVPSGFAKSFWCARGTRRGLQR